jgi:hypothetical protein
VQLTRLMEVRDGPTGRTRLSRRTSFGDVVGAARALTGRDGDGRKVAPSPSPMIGTLSYLIFLELCGKYFVSDPNGRANPTKATERIPFALREWAPTALGCNEASCRRTACRTYPSGHPMPHRICSKAAHLYAFRCALAHDFGFQHTNPRNQTHFSFEFVVDEGGVEPAVTLPQRPWSGKRRASKQRTTVIDADSVGNLAEEVRSNILRDLILRWNRQVVIEDLDDERPGYAPSQESLRILGMEAMDDAQRKVIENDPLDSEVFCGAPGGLKALEACSYDYQDFGPFRELGRRLQAGEL